MKLIYLCLTSFIHLIIHFSLTIAAMIFSNTGGGLYSWTKHAPWHGLTFADTIFPFFIWILGVCIPISIKTQIQRGMTSTKIFSTIFKRSLKLFVLGLCLNTVNGSDFENIRIFGVLQRISISYFIVATVHLALTPKRREESVYYGRISHIMRDVLKIWKEWLVMIVLVLINLILVFQLSYNECPG